MDEIPFVLVSIDQLFENKSTTFCIDSMYLKLHNIFGCFGADMSSLECK